MSNYFSFSGRLNRKKFWLMTLAIYAALLVVVLILSLVMGPLLANMLDGAGSADQFGAFNAGPFMIIFSIIILIVYIAAVVSALSITARRLHDRNRSGWWILWYMLAVIGLSIVGPLFGSVVIYGISTLLTLGLAIWYLVEVGFLRGTDGPNQYGPDPLGGGADAKVFE